MDESRTHFTGNKLMAKYDDVGVNLDKNGKQEESKGECAVMDTLKHLLTSGLGAATEPGQVKVTNS